MVRTITPQMHLGREKYDVTATAQSIVASSAQYSSLDITGLGTKVYLSAL
jgi:hypothetical protein